MTWTTDSAAEAGGMPASVVPSDRGRSVLDAGVVAGLRAVLAEGILPGATDTAASVSTETLAAWVDQARGTALAVPTGKGYACGAIMPSRRRARARPSGADLAWT